MLTSDTSNIYHTAIYNMLIVLLGRSEDLFVADGIFPRWLNRVAHIYHRASKSTTSKKTNPHCFFGHIHRLVKLILGINNNFLQKMLDANNDSVVEAFELFYYPKSEIEKLEFPTSTDTKSEAFDSFMCKFEEEDSEKPGRDFASLHTKEIIEFHFSDQEQEEHEEDKESEPSTAEQTSYNDVNYWRTRLSFDEESLKDLFN